MILKKKEVPTQEKERKRNHDTEGNDTADSDERDDLENEDDNDELFPPLPPLKDRGSCPGFFCPHHSSISPVC